MTKTLHSSRHFEVFVWRGFGENNNNNNYNNNNNNNNNINNNNNNNNETLVKRERPAQNQSSVRCTKNN